MLHGGKVFHDWVDGGHLMVSPAHPQSIMTNTCSSQWVCLRILVENLNTVIQVAIDSLVKHARVDVDRICNGLSDGGGAVRNMTYVYPQRVAKAAPSSAVPQF